MTKSWVDKANTEITIAGRKLSNEDSQDFLYMLDNLLYFDSFPVNYKEIINKFLETSNE